MTEFGGLGGIWDGREIDTDDAFEMSVSRALGEQIASDDAVACEMWCALANVDWKHASGDTASYSFRAAGDLVAAVRGSGMYMDWYCCGPYPVVSGRVAEAMRAEGWTAAETEQRMPKEESA